MGILDRIIGRDDKKAVNQTKKNKKGVYDSIELYALDRSRQEITNWRQALAAWENKQTPDRTEMIRLYNEIALDDQVSSKLGTVIKQLQAAEFDIIEKNGKLNEEKTRLFNGGWYDKLLRYIIEAEAQGYSLVEFPEPENGTYNADNIKLIPREYVQPDAGFVRLRQNDTKGIPFMEPPYNERLVGIGDPADHGFFCSIAPLYIYKKNAMAYWSNYQAKFGIPPVIAKTDLGNDQRVKDLSKFMQEMRSNSWLICDHEDELQPMSAATVDGYLTYRNMIEVLIAGISKIIDGQTMTSDNGSSRAQSEVHERTAESWHVARLRNTE